MRGIIVYLRVSKNMISSAFEADSYVSIIIYLYIVEYSIITISDSSSYASIIEYLDIGNIGSL